MARSPLVDAVEQALLLEHAGAFRPVRARVTIEGVGRDFLRPLGMSD